MAGRKRTSSYPTCNLQLTEMTVQAIKLGIITVYVPQKANGPMRIHTQCVNQIRELSLRDEPVNDKDYV